MLRSWHSGSGLALLLAALAFVGCNANGTSRTKMNKGLPELKTLLKDPDKKVRAEAAEAIRLKGQPAKEAIPDLIALFDDEDAKVRKTAAEALTPVIRDAFPELLKVAKSDKPNVRSMTMFALGNLDIGAPDELWEQGTVVLMDGLRDPEVSVRERAAYSVGHYGSPFVPHMDELSRLIKDDPDKRVRCWLITAVGNMGPPAKAAASVLQATAKDSDNEVSSASKIAYYLITGKEVDEASPAGPPKDAPPSGGTSGEGAPPPNRPPEKTPPKDKDQ